MKPKITLTDVNMKILQTVFGELEDLANVVTTDNDAEETLVQETGDADLLIVCYAPVTRKVLQAATELKAVLKWGVGVDNIDLAAATERRIPVVHCPNYGSDTVADHAFALMITLARKVIDLDRTMRDKAWMWPAPANTAVDLSKKTIGLVGFGRIGKAMARRCAGFGMDIVAYDPYVSTQEFGGVKFVGLEQLLRRSDFVSIHCILTPETAGLIGEKELALMKPSTFLINVSRGGIVDEAALVKSLETRQIAGAGLDVFVHEPTAQHNPLLRMDNTIVTPHFAYNTIEANDRLDREALQKAKNILNGKALADVRNPEALGSSR